MYRFLKKIIATSFLFAFFFSAKAQPITVTAYYAGGPQQVDSFAAEQLTHIIFSFCHLQGAQLHIDDARDTLTIQNLVALKKRNPSLKVLLSLGGWGGCQTCSDVFANKKMRKEFAISVKQITDYFGTDGIDLDWEYPAIQGYPGHVFKPEDKKNFTSLIKALRKQLGKEADISFAAGGFQKFIDQSIEWKKVMKKADRVNLMTYDLVNGYATTTGHHTALHATAQQTEATDKAVNRLLAIGVPANKIVIGAAFYGRMWQAVPNQNNGLYQPGTFKGSVAYKDFDSKLSPAQGFVYYWDDAAKAPYLYNAAQQLFVTYDDKHSMQEKTKYVMQQHLNGIMFWQLTQDLSANGLLQTITETKSTAAQ